MTQVATANSMGNPKLTDFAFHPTNGLLYAVDNDGFLMEIDVNDGSTTVLGEVLNETNAGFNFTFGAQYFDVDEHLYISNNSNGYVYKIDLKSQTPTAEFFAYGPKSQSNDGARCALAPVEVTVGMDFGDAPDSYSTSFATSGPRHLESALFLGSQIDTEVDANLYPQSDDAASNIDDEDGVGFGEHGDGFVRIAVVENVHRTRQALRSIKSFLQRYRAGSLDNLDPGQRALG